MKVTITRTIELEVDHPDVTLEEIVDSFDEYMEQVLDCPHGNVFRWDKEAKVYHDLGEINIANYGPPTEPTPRPRKPGNPMKAEDLTIRVLEGMPLLINIAGTHDVHEAENFTVETNMRNGETCVVLVAGENPISTSARDFEPHPGFPEFNDWLWEEDELLPDTHQWGEDPANMV